MLKSIIPSYICTQLLPFPANSIQFFYLFFDNIICFLYFLKFLLSRSIEIRSWRWRRRTFSALMKKEWKKVKRERYYLKIGILWKPNDGFWKGYKVEMCGLYIWLFCIIILYLCVCSYCVFSFGFPGMRTHNQSCTLNTEV